MQTGLWHLGAFLAYFGAVVLARRLLAREGLAAFGLHADARAWRLLARGALVGGLFAAAEPLVLIATGHGRVAYAGGDATHVVLFLALATLGMAAVGLQEEALFRGWLLPASARRFGLPLAVLACALLFGVMHVIHYQRASDRAFAAASNTLFAIAVSLRVVRQRSILWAIGCHAAWNVVQVCVGDPLQVADALFVWRMPRTVWTGPLGSPEGGLLDLCAVTGLLAWCAWRSRHDEAESGEEAGGRVSCSRLA